MYFNHPRLRTAVLLNKEIPAVMYSLENIIGGLASLNATNDIHLTLL